MGENDCASPVVEWGLARLARQGQEESGDHYLLQPYPNGLLVAVVDGLGHGRKAATVAKMAVATLKQYAHEPVVSLFERCHRELQGTRGVVMSVASISTRQHLMTWLGVGDVRGLLLRANAKPGQAHKSLLLWGGVVGYRLPPLRTANIPISSGDTLILATDGIRESFAEELTRSDPFLHLLDYPAIPGQPAPGASLVQEGTQEIANRTLAQYNRGTDDALVFVVRYVG